jgi:hypothetical protein
VQERVAEELDAIGLLSKPGAPPPREMEFEDLKRLPYLTAVAKEAMRMLPVVSLMGRVTEKTVRIGDYTVPPGVVVGTPLYAIHNTKHNWEAPHEFRPERWLDVPVETYVYNAKAAAPGTTAAAEGAARTNKLAAAAAASKEGITFMPFRWGARGRGGGEGAGARRREGRGGLAVWVPARALAGPLGALGRCACLQAARQLPRGGTLTPALSAPPPPPPPPRARSDGPRSCVGQSLAKAEVMTLLAKILGNFTIGGWLHWGRGKAMGRLP